MTSAKEAKLKPIADKIIYLSNALENLNAVLKTVEDTNKSEVAILILGVEKQITHYRNALKVEIFK